MMMRRIASVLAGLVVWFGVVTVVNLVFRVSWPDYAEAEKPMTFTLGMLGARLAMGALASLCAGFTAARIAGESGMTVKVLTAMLLIVFIPVHYGLWDKFPFWYHAAFLVSLIAFTLLGAVRTANAASTTRSG
jgi:hypothetical protein